MKIAILDINPYPYTFGGVKSRIDGMGKYLSEMRNEVYVISLRARRNSLKLNHPDKIKMLNVGLPYIEFGKSRGVALLVKLIYRPLMIISWILGAGRALREINPDVVDAQDIILSAIPGRNSKKLFITPHGIFGENINRLYKTKPLLLPFIKILEKTKWKNLRHAHTVIALGEEEKNYYSKFSNAQIAENGIDTNLFKPKKDNLDGKTFVYLGRLSKEKNVDRIILAFKNLKEKLLIAGDGDERDKLEKLVRDNNMKNIRFLGLRQDSNKVLNMGEYFIMASDFEVLPIAMLEAMACGRIILVPKVGEIPSVVSNGENGIILERINSEGIRKDILRVVKMGKKSRKNIGKEARKTILNKFDWKLKAKQLGNIYKG